MKTGGRIGREKRGEEPAHRRVLLLLLQIARGAWEAACFLGEEALGRCWIWGCDVPLFFEGKKESTVPLFSSLWMEMKN